MKRRVEDTAKVEGGPPQSLQRAPHTASSVVQTTYPSQAIKSTSTEVSNIQQYSLQSNYVTMPSIATSIKSQSGGGLQGGGGILVQPHIRHNKVQSGSATPPAAGGGGASGGSGGGGGSQQQFQRLKVEDALSYLDQVKYKFGNQPQVYNDFLDIMKEFKSQCIDTPGVIARVSHLFKGYPELISGFNTFLPPGYKIEVQANDTGYSLQVSVSMASPLGGGGTSGVAGSGTTHHTISDIPPLIQTQPTVVVANQANKTTTVYGGSGGGQQQQVVSTSGTTVGSSANSGGGAVHVKHESATSGGGGGGGGPRVVGGSTVATLGAGSSLPAATVTTVPTTNTSTIQPPPPPPPVLLHQPNHQAATQPVEFNHAINYVNKIKNRFQGQPDKYKRFLEILHTYQKEQRTVKEGGGGSGGGGASAGKHLTETEVYAQVAKLFENQEDLLAEFGQFLPDATSHNSAPSSLSNKCGGGGKTQIGIKYNSSTGVGYGNNKTSPPNSKTSSGGGGGGGGSGGSDRGNSGCQGTKRSVQDVYSSGGNTPGAGGATVGSSVNSVAQVSISPAPSSVPVKRQKLQSLTPALSHYAAFDNIKKTLRHQVTYENILRCIYLYNSDVISKTELMLLIGPVLARFPDLVLWLKEFLGTSLDITPPPPPPPPQSPPQPLPQAQVPPSAPVPLPVPPQVASSHQHHHHSHSHHHQHTLSDLHNNLRPERPEPATDIDFSTCKRIGASYRALPKNHNHPKCTGRTELCKEVLNDTWVSFPTWSEEAPFVTSRKTQYEEYIYRCEDERFELDLVIECNAATIRVLDSVQRRMSRMSPEELAKFRLDDTLGGTSSTIHIRALKRIYGEKASDIVEGLKKNPNVAVPVVLRRLKNKEMEWRQAQKGFNKIWRDQNEKFYLKSLDHQGINFKQNDVKALRSKSLYNEIESAYDERHESGEEKTGPHMVLCYKERSVLDDAANLLIHHVKRQTTIHKQDKQRIKQLLRHFLPDLFHHPRQQLSDDERDDDEKMDVDSPTGNKLGSNGPLNTPVIKEEEIKTEPMDSRDDERLHLHPTSISPFPDEEYTLFFGNNNWYLFVRLHQILCDRLAKMAEQSVRIAEEEAHNSTNRKESTAVALRLKPNEHVEDCYAAMLEMVKSVLDCSMDPSTYEDTLRNMFGIHAYIGFTLDRVVSYAVRQLQQLVTEENCTECWELHLLERSRGGGGGACRTAFQRAQLEAAYMRAAISHLQGDNCYKIYIYKRDCKLTIELLDTDGEEEGGGGNVSGGGGGSGGGAGSGLNSVKSAAKWSAYVDSLVDPSEKLDPTLNVEDRERWGKAVYLKRNLRTWTDTKPLPPLSIPEVQTSHLAPAQSSQAQSMSQSEPTSSTGDVPDNLSSTGLKNSTPDGNVGSCEFNPLMNLPSNDKMVYVVSRDSFLYKRKALQRARQTHRAISCRLYQQFEQWHLKWAEANVSDTQREASSRWLMGLMSDTMVANTTTLLTCGGNTINGGDNDSNAVPYRSYNRYTVRYPPPPPSQKD